MNCSRRMYSNSPQQVKIVRWKQFYSNRIDKTIQQALIPRSILIVLLAGISIFMTIFMPSWCEKWWILFALLAIALFIAIPRKLRFRSFAKVFAIPGLVLRMFKNLLHIDRKNTYFIHTQHG